MRTRFILLAVLAVMLAVVVGPDSVRAQQTTVLNNALDAHGGLNTWEKFGTVEYDFSLQIGDATRDDHHIFDLNKRHVRVEHSSYTVGITKDRAWVAPDMETYGYTAPPRFYGKAYTYLFSVPFVFADPGVNVESAGQRPLKGTSYDVLKITFDEGVGDTPRDVFYLYLDPDSHQVHAALFSVTYRNPSVTRPITGVVYNEWTTANGLTVPRTATMYGVSKDQTLQKKLGTFEYQNVSFRTDTPSADRFAMPEQAVPDTSLQARKGK
jgi:hypothetical protein